MSYMVEMYRLEREGHGPCNPNPQSKNLWGDYTIKTALLRRFGSKNSKHRGSTIEWEIGDNREKFLFGCATIGDLYDLFGTRIINLCLREGYRVKAYLVASCDVRYGKREMVAKLRKGPAQQPRNYLEIRRT